MTYSDCDPDRPTTPESRLRDALEADVARHKTAIRVGFAILREGLMPENVHYDAALDAWSLYSNRPTPFAFDVMKQQMAMNNPYISPQTAMMLDQSTNALNSGNRLAGWQTIGNPFVW